MTAPVHVVVHEDAGYTVVTARGPLYLDTVGPLADVLLLLGARERPRVVLDLSGVAACDSSGLNLMAQTRREAARRGGWLRLVAPQPGVRRVLEITNLVRVLPIYGSVDAAAHDSHT